MTDKEEKPPVSIGVHNGELKGLSPDDSTPTVAAATDALNRPSQEDPPGSPTKPDEERVESVLTPVSELGSVAAMEATVAAQTRTRTYARSDPVDLLTNPAIGIGILVKVETGNDRVAYGALPFSASLQAWDALVALVCTHVGISREDLLQPGGSRPKDNVVRAQTFLVHALRRIAGDEDALVWLKHVGFERRWIQRKLGLELDAEQQHELRGLNPQIVFNATLEPPSESPV